MYYRRRSVFLSPVMIILYISLVLIGAVYFAGVFFFQDRYLPNTTVGNIECGWKNYEYVEEINKSQTEGYTLMVHDRKEKTYVIEGKDFDYKYVNLGEEKQIMEEQNKFLWPIALFEANTHALTYSVTYNEEKLQNLIVHLSVFSDKYYEKPTDAYIELKKDGYTIVPEQMGCQPISEQVCKEVMDAVKFTATAIVLSDACYVAPNLHTSSEPILNAANTIDSYLSHEIKYTIWGKEQVFGREEIMSAIRLSADYEVTLDREVFWEYTYTYLSKPYNTYSDARTFVTHDGKEIIIGGGDYGWTINREKETAEMMRNVMTGENLERQPIWSQVAKADGPNDIGNSYVEIDYTNQHIYYFKDGKKMFDAPIVSGSMNENCGSPDGIFDIDYMEHKESGIPLVGEDYESTVTYFLQWAYNIGFHDATWRKNKEFGGDTYLDDGSHGCINMKLADVTKLYELLPKNGGKTPVVAYYRDPVVLTSESAKKNLAYSYRAPEVPSTEE